MLQAKFMNLSIRDTSNSACIGIIRQLLHFVTTDGCSIMNYQPL